jgi:hypothetical protein
MAPNHTTLPCKNAKPYLHHKEIRKTKRRGRKITIITVILDGGSRRWNQFQRQQQRVVLFTIVVPG